MHKAQKYQSVAQISKLYDESQLIIITHYHGLSVAQMTTLRKSLNANGAEYKVVKNTLSEIAIGHKSHKDFVSLLSGPTALAYSKDPIAAAKSVVDFAKNNPLKIVGAIVGGKSISAADVAKLAALPSLNELRSSLLRLIQTPATKIANLLNAPSTQVVRVLNAHSKK